MALPLMAPTKPTSKTSSSSRRNNDFPFGVHSPVGGAEEINVPVFLVRN